MLAWTESTFDLTPEKPSAPAHLTASDMVTNLCNAFDVIATLHVIAAFHGIAALNVNAALHTMWLWL